MRRRHKAFVQNYLKTTGSIGQAVYDTKDGDPVAVPCNAHPLTADESTEYGLQGIETRHVYADSWPGNLHSRITILGVEYDPHGPAQRYDLTDNANSWQVILKKRG